MSSHHVGQGKNDILYLLVQNTIIIILDYCSSNLFDWLHTCIISTDMLCLQRVLLLLLPPWLPLQLLQRRQVTAAAPASHYQHLPSPWLPATWAVPRAPARRTFLLYWAWLRWVWRPWPRITNSSSRDYRPATSTCRIQQTVNDWGFISRGSLSLRHHTSHK